MSAARTITVLLVMNLVLLVWCPVLLGAPFDKPVVIQCYTSEKGIETGAKSLRDFLVRMGTETNQGAVGFVIDDQYLEIGFPLNV